VLCHVEAALDVALQALRVHPHSSSNPGAAAGVPGTPPATQEARSGGGFGMSCVRGHKLLHLLARLLFYDDPGFSRHSLCGAIKHCCCMVIEGKWKELWERARTADAVDRVTADEEADICDIVSVLVSQALLSKALRKAADCCFPPLEPDVIEQLPPALPRQGRPSSRG
jgi:hypothetical protein